MNDFEKRMYEGGQQVYDQIVDPNRNFDPTAGPLDVEAALMDAHLKASQHD